MATDDGAKTDGAKTDGGTAADTHEGDLEVRGELLRVAHEPRGNGWSAFHLRLEDGREVAYPCSGVLGRSVDRSISKTDRRVTLTIGWRSGVVTGITYESELGPPG